MYDQVNAPGVAADLSHIDTPAKVTGHGMNMKQFKGDEVIDNKEAFMAKEFDNALKGCDVVVRAIGNLFVFLHIFIVRSSIHLEFSTFHLAPLVPR